jgi:hypothetical protein
MGSAQHGDLMPQHEELGVVGGRRTTEQDQPATDPDEDQIEEAEGHGRSSWPTEDPAASLQFTGQADLWHPIGHPGKATGQARRSRANQRARCERASRTSGAPPGDTGGPGEAYGQSSCPPSASMSRPPLAVGHRVRGHRLRRKQVLGRLTSPIVYSSPTGSGHANRVTGNPSPDPIVIKLQRHSFCRQRAGWRWPRRPCRSPGHPEGAGPRHP